MMAYIMAGVSQRTVYIMRKDIKNKLDRLPLKYFDGRTHGEILSRVTNDVDNISTTLQQSLTQLITALVTLVGILVMMISISRLLTLIALVTLPVCAFITTFIAKKSQKYFAEQQKNTWRIKRPYRRDVHRTQDHQSFRARRELNQKILRSKYQAL